MDALHISVIGTGTLGEAVARRLLDRGFPVSVWNRTHSRALPLASAGARVCRTPTEAVTGADVVITLLFDAAAVLDVMRDAWSGVSASVVWMQSSTVGVQGSREIAELARARGIRCVDAPVLGTRGPALEGTLTALLAGADEDVARLDPVLQALCTHRTVAGSAAPAASALKLAMNTWIAALTAGAAQAMAVAERLGVREELVLDALSGTGMTSPYIQGKGAAMLRQDYPVQFSVDALAKDLHLALRETPGQAPMLLTALAGLFQEAVASGHGADDIAAVRESFGHSVG